MMFMRSLSWRHKFSKKDQHNNHITTSTNNVSDNSNETSQQQQSIPQLWLEDEVKVKNATCNYPVEYLGYTEVFESRGVVVCEKAIRALKSQTRRRCKKAVIHISGDAIRVVDEINKVLLVDQTLEKVSFCAPDRNLNEGFAYICRDASTKRWLCHGFLAIKDSGDRISHALGTAFAVCLERKVNREKLLASQMVAATSLTTVATTTTTTANINSSNNHNKDDDNSVRTTGDDNDVCSKKFYFRQASLVDRINDPQITMVTDPIPRRKVENKFEIKRPHASVRMFNLNFAATAFNDNSIVHDSNNNNNIIHDSNNNNNIIHDSNNNVSNNINNFARQGSNSYYVRNVEAAIDSDFQNYLFPVSQSKPYGTANNFVVANAPANVSSDEAFNEGSDDHLATCMNRFQRQYSVPLPLGRNKFYHYSNNDNNNINSNNIIDNGNNDNINVVKTDDGDVHFYKQYSSHKPADLTEHSTMKTEFSKADENSSNNSGGHVARSRKLSEAEVWLQNISANVKINGSINQHQQQQQNHQHLLNPFETALHNDNINNTNTSNMPAAFVYRPLDARDVTTTTPAATIGTTAAAVHTAVNNVIADHSNNGCNYFIGSGHNYTYYYNNYPIYNNIVDTTTTTTTDMNADNKCFLLQPVDYVKSAPIQLSPNNPFL